MGQAERDASWERAEKAGKKLTSALDKLSARSDARLQKEYGLTSNFSESVSSESEAMQLCDKAMERLAMDYVRTLEALRDSTLGSHALYYLEESEVIWKAETSVIKEFDHENSQEGFFQEMRQLTLRILEDRLHEASTLCSRDASAENVAMVIALLGVMDQIWAEMGFPPTYSERQKFREIAAGFAD